MRSDCTDALNVGSDEMVSINELAEMIARVANKNVQFEHVRGPLGVRGRNSDNHLIVERLGWRPSRAAHPRHRKDVSMDCQAGADEQGTPQHRDVEIYGILQASRML